MKNLIFLFLTLSPSFIFSQSINENWMFTIGDSSEINRIQLEGLMDPGSSGVDALWDFSMINIDSTLIEHSTKYSSADNFGVNSLSEITTISSLASIGIGKVSYFDLIDGDLFHFGDSILTGTKITFDPPILRFSFPFDFDEVSTVFSTASVYDNTGNNFATNDLKITRKFDGIGTLITPSGTFENCVRIKEEYLSNPQSPLPLIIDRYYWYYNKLSNEMAKVTIQPGLNNSFFSWQSNINQASSATKNELKSVPIIKYLTNNKFQVDNINGMFSVMIFDSSGRMLETQRIKFDKTQSNFELKRSYESPNILFALFVNAKTNEFFTHKFVP